MNKFGGSFSAQKPKKQSLYQRRQLRNSNNNLTELEKGSKAETKSVSSMQLSLHNQGSLMGKSPKPSATFISPIVKLQSGIYDLDFGYAKTAPTHFEN